MMLPRPVTFGDRPDVLITAIAAGLIGLVLLLPVGAEQGKRSATAVTAQADA